MATEQQKNDLFDDLIESESKEEKTSLDVLKELFNKKDIETKTELLQTEIIIINSKLMISKMLDWQRLEEALHNYMILQVSKNRKGRTEFIDAFKAEREKELNKNNNGFFSGLKNKLGFE